MSAARQAFYQNARAMIKLSKEILLTDTFPPNAPHNAGARILRRGLTVSAFAHLEAYLEGRLEELAIELSKCQLSFVDLGERLRHFLTVEAALGLANRLQFMPKGDQRPFAEAQLLRLAQHSASPPTYTAQGFSPKGSNVSSKDISVAISALGVENGWQRLSSIMSQIGATRVSLYDDYENLYKTRNHAAHNSNFNVPTSDLQTHLENITSIGIAFDVLTTALVEAHVSAVNSHMLATAIQKATWSFRFFDELVSGSWAERAKLTGKIVKVYASEAAARSGALGRTGGGFTIARDIRQVPVELF